MNPDKNKTKEQADQERVRKIKNSLAVILGNTELLLQQEEWFSKNGKKHLQGIKKEVWRINELLDKSGFSLSS